MFNIFDGNMYRNPEEFIRDADFTTNTVLLKLMDALPHGVMMLLTAEFQRDNSLKNVFNILYTVSSVGNIAAVEHIFGCLPSNGEVYGQCFEVVIYSAYTHKQRELLLKIFGALCFAAEFTVGLACVRGDIETVRWVYKLVNNGHTWENKHGSDVKEYCVLAWRGDRAVIREWLVSL